MATNITAIRPKTKAFINIEEVRKAFPLFAKEGQVIELRALNATLHSDRQPYDRPRVIAGWLDNADALVTSLQQIASAEGIYVTINPCEPALLARANNRLKDKKVTATTDDQIVKRQLLILDTDPERAGHVTGVPTNDTEHQAALDFIETVCEALKALGWPEPLKFDSGNGAYLIYAIDLPANDNGLIERVLKGVAQRFDTEQVHTDLTTFNQSRIARLPGTMNCKGDGTQDRPHRMAKIISIPDDIQPVPIELLEAIAASIEDEQKQQKPSNNNAFSNKKGISSAKDFIEKYEIATVREEPYKKNGIKYLLAECPFCHENDNCACIYDSPIVGLGFSCSHNRCKDLQWQDLRLLFEPNAYDRQDSTDWKSKSYGPTPSSEEAYWNDEPEQPPLETVWQRLGENEWGDALLFAEVFRDRILYDASNKEYYHWNEHHWKLDSMNYVRQLVSGHLGSVYMKAAAEVNVKWAELEARISKLQKGSEEITELKTEQGELNTQMEALKKRCYALRGAKRCLAVLGFVQTDPRIAVTGDCWDRDKWAMPVLNGVIDLHTGMLRPGLPRDYIRTVAPVEWQGLNTLAPRFERFLQEIFEDRPQDERQELIAFLQRLLGYAITGLSEKAIFPILYGKEGRNGKDTLLALIKAILGPLAGAVSNDLFLDSKVARAAGSATPHVCDLQGKRVVWGSETKQGDKLNVPQIKLFTGGGELSTRQLHGRQYAFSPTHTLLLMTNHRPHADADEEAFWTRACLIDFKMRFLAPDEVQGEYDRPQDETLKATLLNELSGILAWLVKGCISYQEQGFCQPASVRMATAEYRKSEDQIQLFVEECCLINEKHFVKAKQAYDAYKAWCFENNHNAMNNRLFSDKFGSRFKKDHIESGNIYRGVGLVTFNPPQNPEGTEGKKSHPEGKNDNPSATSQPASEVPSDRHYQECPEGTEGNFELFPLICPRESDSGPKVDSSLHSFSHAGTNGHINQPVEPSESLLKDKDSSFSHPSGTFLVGIPTEYQQLFTQYITTMPISDTKEVFWHSLDSGYSNGYLKPSEHIARVRSLLQSDNRGKVSAAEEVMERVLGIGGRRNNHE